VQEVLWWPGQVWGQKEPSSWAARHSQRFSEGVRGFLMCVERRSAGGGGVGGGGVVRVVGVWSSSVDRSPGMVQPSYCLCRQSGHLFHDPLWTASSSSSSDKGVGCLSVCVVSCLVPDSSSSCSCTSIIMVSRLSVAGRKELG
jgi:hypothetical protein